MVRRAFTYIELLIVAVVLAIVTILALPDSDAAAKEQGRQAARRLESDISYARSLSIAQPVDPAILKISPDDNRYWIARSSSPDTPIAHPITGNSFCVQFGPNGTPGFEYVAIAAADLGGDNVRTRPEGARF